MKDSQAYLSICAIYRNEARYMPEWIEFHRLLGVERFFLFNNRSTDDHLEVLAPTWTTAPSSGTTGRCSPVSEGVRAPASRSTAHDSRWIAFIDLDEFLFSPTGRLLPDVLSDFEAYPGVVVNMINYGTSGHETPPAGLAIENYTRRLGSTARATDGQEHRRTRNAPAASAGPPTTSSTPTARRPSTRTSRLARRHATEEVSVDLLRINHYFTRSQEERNEKIAAPRHPPRQAGPEPRESGGARSPAERGSGPDTRPVRSRRARGARRA